MLGSKRIIWAPLIITLLLTVFTSSFYISDYSFYDEKRIAQVFILLLSSVSFLVIIFKNALVGLGNIIKIGLGLVLVLLFISASSALLPRWAYLQVGWYILLFEFFLITAYLYQKNNRFFIKIILIGLISLCVIYTSRVYADYIIGSIHDYWTTWPNQRPYKIMYDGVNLFPSGFLGFSNHRFFNHLQTWSLPLLVFGYIYFRNKIIPGLRYLLIFFISSWWMLVFASDARGTMLASLLSITFIIFLFRKRSFDFAKVYGLTAVVGSVLYVLLFLLPSGSEGKEILTRFHDSGRFEVWSLAIEHIIKNPLLGIGPMHFNHADLNPFFKAPHNILLQFGAEFGIPTMVLIIGIGLYGFYTFVHQSVRTVVKENNFLQTNLRIGFIASMTAALVHAFFSGIYDTPLSQLLGIIIIGAAVGDYFLSEQANFFVKRKGKSFNVYLIALILIGNTLFVGKIVAEDMPHLNENKEEFLRKFHAKGYYPRFWNQGVIYDKGEGRTENGEKEIRSE